MDDPTCSAGCLMALKKRGMYDSTNQKNLLESCKRYQCVFGEIAISSSFDPTNRMSKLTIERCCDLIGSSLYLVMERLDDLRIVTQIEDCVLDCRNDLEYDEFKGAYKLDAISPFQPGNSLFPSTKNSKISICLSASTLQQPRLFGTKYFVDNDDRVSLFTKPHSFSCRVKHVLNMISEDKTSFSKAYSIKYAGISTGLVMKNIEGVQRVRVSLEGESNLYNGPIGPLKTLNDSAELFFSQESSLKSHVNFDHHPDAIVVVQFDPDCRNESFEIYSNTVKVVDYFPASFSYFISQSSFLFSE